MFLPLILNAKDAEYLQKKFWKHSKEEERSILKNEKIYKDYIGMAIFEEFGVIEQLKYMNRKHYLVGFTGTIDYFTLALYKGKLH